MRSEAGLWSLLDWSDMSWQIAEVDSRGRIVRLGAHPFGLALLFGFVTSCCLSFAWGAWKFFDQTTQTQREADEGLSDRLEKVGKELDDEMSSLMSLLKQHLDLSGTHSESLARAADGLLASTSPDGIRAIIQYL
nr:GGDEF domain-containing protein [Hyphomicrobium sp.]